MREQMKFFGEEWKRIRFVILIHRTQRSVSNAKDQMSIARAETARRSDDFQRLRRDELQTFSLREKLVTLRSSNGFPSLCLIISLSKKLNRRHYAHVRRRGQGHPSRLEMSRSRLPVRSPLTFDEDYLEESNQLV